MKTRSPHARRRLAIPSALFAALPAVLLGVAPASLARAAGAAQAPAAKATATATATATLHAGEPARPSSFSVEMVVQKDGQSFTIKRTVDGGKSRMDMSGQGHDMSMIQLDDDKRTMYTVSPERKMVIKQSMAAQMERMGKKGGNSAAEAAPKPDAQAESAADASNNIEYLGKETLDGKETEKYKVDYADGSGTMWLDAQTNYPLRMESQGATVEFKNYRFGPQPAGTFQPPAGWEVKDFDAMMAGMPKNMMGGMASNMAGQMGGGLGGSLGSSLGGALGGPLGAMAGQFVGQKIGQSLGHKVAGAATGTGK
jgi:outer membrane lipoprotein-sorting protein